MVMYPSGMNLIMNWHVTITLRLIPIWLLEQLDLPRATGIILLLTIIQMLPTGELLHYASMTLLITILEQVPLN